MNHASLKVTVEFGESVLAEEIFLLADLGIDPSYKGLGSSM